MRSIIVLLLAAGAALAQVPVITPGATSLQATQSATVTCTANCTGLTWKVNGVTGGNATVGTISGSGSTATYTAPSSVVANNSWGGCPTGFNDELWNTPVAGMPLISNWKGNPFLNSDWYITYNLLSDGHKGSMAGAVPGIADTFGITFAHTTPTITAAGVNNIPWPQTPSRFRETGVYNWDFTDQHIPIIDIDLCRLWEEYDDKSQLVTCTVGQTAPCYGASSAAQLPRNSYTRIGGTDAAGNMISPYLLHLSEVKSGVVRHAVHLNMPQGLDSYANNLMWPATWGTGFCSGNMVVGLSGFPTGSGYSAATTITFSGGGGDGTETWTPIISGGVITGATIKHAANSAQFTSAPAVVITDTGGGSGASLTATIGIPCMPYGSRLALDQTYLAQHAGAGCSAGSNCITGAGLVVATALANYGGIVLDNQGGGGGWLFNAANDFREDPATLNSIFSALSHLTIDHWHVYDQTKLAVSTAAGIDNAHGCNDYSNGDPCVSTQVLPGNDLGYIPPGADWITATNASGTSLPITIPLQPATIGTTDTMLWMLAGDYSGSKGTSGGYQIPYWVHGHPNLAVTWSLQASPNGSITAGGIYTPPETVTTTGLQDIATCTLTADPNVTAQVYINLLPNAGNYAANTIRVDTGNSSNYGPDGNGHYWLGNIGFYSGGVGFQNAAWNKLSSSAVAEQIVYNTSIYAYNDMVYTFIVPNGNYRVRFMSGRDQAFWGNFKISDTSWRGQPLMVWSNDNGYNGQSGGSGGIKGLFWNMQEAASTTGSDDSDSDFIFGDKVVDNRLTAAIGGGNPNIGTSENVGFPACFIQYGIPRNVGNTPQDCSTLPELSGVDIEPDATAPHWTIGVTNAVTPTSVTSFVSSKPIVAAGKQIGLYIQDWYTGLTDQTSGMTDPIWTIVSGPGTLSAQPITTMTPALSFPLEVYTAPSGSLYGNTSVVIKAQSQSNPSISATIRLSVDSGAFVPVFFK